MPIKNVNLQTASDYWPIVLMCFLSKVLEKIAHEQIMEHLTESHILDPLQTGFQPYDSTKTALLKLMEDMIRNGQKNGYNTHFI